MRLSNKYFKTSQNNNRNTRKNGHAANNPSSEFRTKVELVRTITDFSRGITYGITSMSIESVIGKKGKESRLMKYGR